MEECYMEDLLIRSMVNLLEETISIMKKYSKKPEDVDWVGSRDGTYACSWEEFCKLANKKYDSGYGEVEVARDLVVVFKDGSWLERHEYDGDEWWEYKSTPQRSKNPKKIYCIFRSEFPWDDFEFPIECEYIGNRHATEFLKGLNMPFEKQNTIKN